MPDLLVALMLLLAVAVGWLGVIRLNRSVRHTSLTAAAAWAIWFQVTLTVTTIATLAKGRVPTGILDQLWYLTAVSALCPFVAVLGARRGRLLEWSLFIVLPLIVVLEWPALAQWKPCWNGQRLELEMPTMAGYGLVMVMSLGNYVPPEPRSISPKFILWMGSWGSLICGLFPPWPPQWSYGMLLLILGLVAFQITFWLHVSDALHRNMDRAGWDRVWFDYQPFFGTVWAVRLMRRVNEVAEREHWPWRLTHGGWEPMSHEQQPSRPPIDDPRIGHTVRWLLKPFVDPEWIDERLNATLPTRDSMPRSPES